MLYLNAPRVFPAGRWAVLPVGITTAAFPDTPTRPVPVAVKLMLPLAKFVEIIVVEKVKLPMTPLPEVVFPAVILPVVLIVFEPKLASRLVTLALL